MINIFSEKFKKKTLNEIKEYKYGENWPVVYIINNDKEAYIGETTSAYRRTKTHLDNKQRKKLDDIHIITDKDYNKSATLDLESKLIEYFAGDGKFKLQNSNRGQRDHKYYQKSMYNDKFEVIWNELLSMQLANNKIIDIENSDLFKLSPFKVLTEEQVAIVDQIEQTILKQNESNSIIKGEPGSGKTILAIYLVKYLLSHEQLNNMNIALVLPMTSLRQTIKSVFKTINGLYANMVIGPYDVRKNEGKYDLLIVDEAHRLARRKNLSNYAAFDNVNEDLGFDKHKGTQIDWILKKSKHTVLMYDNKQTVKPTDISSDKLKNLDSNWYNLESQFRVKAGRKYTEYIDNLLTQQLDKKIDFGEYDLKLFDDVQAMVDAIKMRNQEVGLARTVAGYAWNWESKKDSSKYDIFIDDYQFKWNSVNKDWINSENAINEIGCIHTVQGYDLNYAGVIIGPELIMRDGKIQFVYENYKDSMAKDSSITNEEMMDYILNIYKVLLTRGILGTYIYVCDDQLRQYFKKYISSAKRFTLKFIDLKNNKTIKLNNDLENEAKVHSYGEIAAGHLKPINVENNTSLNIPKEILEPNKDYFLLKVEGDSMIGKSIMEDDYVLVKQQNYANNGDIVIAVINETATLKTIYYEDNIVKLKPANKNYEPLYVRESNLYLNGVVVGIIKNNKV